LGIIAGATPDASVRPGLGPARLSFDRGWEKRDRLEGRSSLKRRSWRAWNLARRSA